jgi:CRISPR system Cascade subunit CasD
MPQHLILRLEASLMSFGGTMIDANGPTLDLPIRSMVTGLIANALGWHRVERNRHQSLQDRLVMGARLDRPGTAVRDFQTALLFEDDQGWTTRGTPEGRSKSPSYSRGRSGRKELNHIRQRHYRADAFVTIAVRLDPPDGEPTLADVESALKAPARPLFIGRKSCLPSRPILSEPPVEAENLLTALRLAPLAPTDQSHIRPADRQPQVRFALPPGEWPRDAHHRSGVLADVRDWRAGVHAGESRLDHFSLPLADFVLMSLDSLP